MPRMLTDRQKAERMIRIARAELRGPMESSARLALADAVALFDSGDYEHALMRANRSLEYSGGRKKNPAPSGALGGIVTKFLSATNTKGSRIKATHSASGKSVTTGYQYDLSEYGNHLHAANTLKAKLGYSGDLGTAITGLKGGYAFALMDEMTRKSNPALKPRASAAVLKKAKALAQKRASETGSVYYVTREGKVFASDGENYAWHLGRGEVHFTATPRKANPAPKMAFAIYARKGNGPRMHFDGRKFSNNGRPKRFATTAEAGAVGRELLATYPILKGYVVEVAPIPTKRGERAALADATRAARDLGKL